MKDGAADAEGESRDAHFSEAGGLDSEFEGFEGV